MAVGALSSFPFLSSASSSTHPQSTNNKRQQGNTSASENKCGKFAIVGYYGRPTVFIKQCAYSKPVHHHRIVVNNRVLAGLKEIRKFLRNLKGTLSSCKYKYNAS